MLNNPKNCLNLRLYDYKCGWYHKDNTIILVCVQKRYR